MQRTRTTATGPRPEGIPAYHLGRPASFYRRRYGVRRNGGRS